MNESTTDRTRMVPTFSSERCKLCGICSHVCPTGAITSGPEGAPTLEDPDACTSCRLCEHMCPDFAVSMVDRDAVAAGPRGPMAGSRADEHPPEAPEMCHSLEACDD